MVIRWPGLARCVQCAATPMWLVEVVIGAAPGVVVVVMTIACFQVSGPATRGSAGPASAVTGSSAPDMSASCALEMRRLATGAKPTVRTGRAASSSGEVAEAVSHRTSSRPGAQARAVPMLRNRRVQGWISPVLPARDCLPDDPSLWGGACRFRRGDAVPGAPAWQGPRLQDRRT